MCAKNKKTEQASTKTTHSDQTRRKPNIKEKEKAPGNAETQPTTSAQCCLDKVLLEAKGNLAKKTKENIS